MALNFDVLGEPGRDNAVLVRVDSGQAVHRLLFDCGEGCLAALRIAEVQAVDHLFFSHFHMDHVGGFDSFFRANFNRPSEPVHVWGPPGSCEILHHRFRGFLWNLHEDQPGEWRVHEIHRKGLRHYRFRAADAFATAEVLGSEPSAGTVLDDATLSVTAVLMDHRTPSAAYLVREKPRRNFDTERLAALGIPPGPWLQKIKEHSPGDLDTIEIDGVTHDIATLERDVLRESPGDSLAYLTDFLLDEEAEETLAAALHDCGTLICESQYRTEDGTLARENYHMTVGQAARLARRLHVKRLVLFHLSERYTKDEWLAMLADARTIFENTSFPQGWEGRLQEGGSS